MPSATILSSSSGVRATPPPRPPRVKAGRTTHGRPTSGSDRRACSTVVALALRGIASPARAIAAANRARSSAQVIAS